MSMLLVELNYGFKMYAYDIKQLGSSLKETPRGEDELPNDGQDANDLVQAQNWTKVQYFYVRF